MNTQIEIKYLPEFKLMGIAHIGEFEKTLSIYEKLENWLYTHNQTLSPNINKVTIYHDNPRITNPSKTRWSTCVKIEDNVSSEGEIREIIIQTGKFAVGHFELTPITFPQAWEDMLVWVKDNEYTFRDGDYFEVFYNDYRTEPEPKFIVDICIPIE